MGRVSSSQLSTNLSFLRDHAAFTSHGIEERAFFMDSSDGNCFALLCAPSRPKALGFVICHSYGLEFLTLRRLERAIARALAALGHPVLSFHARGYGDSSGSLEDVTLESHLADLNAGMSWLRKETGISQIGLVGGGFGGLIAALRAKDGGVRRLVLVNPALRGATYLRQFLRQRLMVQLSSDNGTGETTQELLDRMRIDGYVDVLGHPLYLNFFEEVSKVNLVSDTSQASGDGLLVHVSKSLAIPSDLAAFSTLMRGLGGTCRVETVKEPPGTFFGGPAFVTGSDSRARVNLQEPMERGISDRITGWVSHEL